MCSTAKAPADAVAFLLREQLGTETIAQRTDLAVHVVVLVDAEHRKHKASIPTSAVL
jgi:hypothetical protein